jgi:hypothetical protein
VDEAALVTVHGRQTNGAAGVPDAIGLLADVGEHLILLDEAVMGDVHARFGGVGESVMEEAVEQVLNVLQSFALAPDEKFPLVGEHLERQAGRGFAVFDVNDKAEISQ